MVACPHLVCAKRRPELPFSHYYLIWFQRADKARDPSSCVRMFEHACTDKNKQTRAQMDTETQHNTNRNLQPVLGCCSLRFFSASRPIFVGVRACTTVLLICPSRWTCFIQSTMLTHVCSACFDTQRSVLLSDIRTYYNSVLTAIPSGALSWHQWVPQSVPERRLLGKSRWAKGRMGRLANRGLGRINDHRYDSHILCPGVASDSIF